MYQGGGNAVLPGIGDGTDNIQMYQEDGWTTVARMKARREGHAVAVVNINDFC